MSNFPTDMIEATDRLCAETPRYAAIRQVLLDLEADGHRAGWDHPVNAPTIFTFTRDRLLGRVHAHPSPVVNLALRVGLIRGSGEPGEVLAHLAAAFDQAREEVGPTEVTDTPGVDFYGYAFRGEGWAVDEPDDTAREAAQRHELYRHPGRVEIRQVYLAGRDGLSWWVLRRRGQDPQVLAALPESTTWNQGGLVPNALVRMTNARAQSHAPVPAQNPSEIIGTEGG